MPTAVYMRRPLSFQVATDRFGHRKTASRNPTGPPVHTDRPMFSIFRDFTVQD